MRGRVVFVNPATLTGLIFGADRERYIFPLNEWTEPGAPLRNTEVSFRIQGGMASKVKPFSPEDAGLGEIDETQFDPLADLLPSTPYLDLAPATAKATSATQRPTPSFAFDDQLAAETSGVETSRASTLGVEPPDADENEIDLAAFDLAEKLLDRDDAATISSGPAALPPTGKILFSMDGAVARRSPWKAYAIGVLITLLLVVIGMVVTHLSR